MKKTNAAVLILLTSVSAAFPGYALLNDARKAHLRAGVDCWDCQSLIQQVQTRCWEKNPDGTKGAGQNRWWCWPIGNASKGKVKVPTGYFSVTESMTNNGICRSLKTSLDCGYSQDCTTVGKKNCPGGNE
jgi:hypothetical protein